MQADTWYDLALRELSELTDPAREILEDAGLTGDLPGECPRVDRPEPMEAADRKEDRKP